MNGRSMFRLQPRLLALFLVLLALEVGIARYVHSGPVRAVVGDVLVVPTLFCLLRGCVQLPVALAAALVLGFACLIEASQAFALVDWLGLHGQTLVHRVLRIALGATFDALDFVAYGLGCWLCLVTGHRPRPGYRPQRVAWP